MKYKLSFGRVLGLNNFDSFSNYTVEAFKTVQNVIFRLKVIVLGTEVGSTHSHTYGIMSAIQ